MTEFQIKKRGVYKVKTMRTIQLFSEAFNMEKGIEVIKRIEELNLLLEEQSSSQKYRRWVLTTFIKVLVTNMSRQTRLSMTNNRNDTHTCYDLIVLYILSLVIQ